MCNTIWQKLNICIVPDFCTPKVIHQDEEEEEQQDSLLLNTTRRTESHRQSYLRTRRQRGFFFRILVSSSQQVLLHCLQQSKHVRFISSGLVGSDKCRTTTHTFYIFVVPGDTNACPFLRLFTYIHLWDLVFTSALDFIPFNPQEINKYTNKLLP